MSEQKRAKITERVFTSYLECRRQAFLQLHRYKGEQTSTDEHNRIFESAYQKSAIAHIISQYDKRDVLRRKILTLSAIESCSILLVVDEMKVDGLSSGPTLFKKARNGTLGLDPIHMRRYRILAKKDKLVLGYKAMLLSELCGHESKRGQIVHGEEFTSTRVTLSPHIKKARFIVQELVEMSQRKTEDILLNSHCNVCEFRALCRSKAEEAGNLSLIQGMRRGHIQQQNKKGIFTIHQLSFTFRPRRAPKRAKNPANPRHFALHAQALRENKIFIHGRPGIPGNSQSLFVDIEGVPASRSYYLIGVLVREGGKLNYRSFWSNDKSCQTAMFDDFIEFVGQYPNASLIHYGSYDAKALIEMAKGTVPQRREAFERVIGSFYNVLPVMRSHCYFPFYSTRLRDIAEFLGCQFDGRISSGAESVVVREQWEIFQKLNLKNDLLVYNREDCLALATVYDFLKNCVDLASQSKFLEGRDEEIVLTDSLRRAGDGNRPKFQRADFIVPEFEYANRCSYFDYQRDRVFARTKKAPRKRSPRARRVRRLRSREAEVVVRCVNCPECGGSRLKIERVFRRQLIDLKFFKSGIGVKQWLPNYVIYRYRCRGCNSLVISPSIKFNVKARREYGHGLKCWCVYHNIIGKQSMLQVKRDLRDLFGLEIPGPHRFRQDLASKYRLTYVELLREILKSPVLNIDETPIKLRKSVGYVWVLATFNMVYFFFRDSREGDFLKELLADFNGILIADFFTAYDSVPCQHQKCLVHLMRDINDDLRRHPFDTELRMVAEEFGRFIKCAVSSIDRWGLKAYHLRKHVKQSERLLQKVTGNNFNLKSDCALKYAKRFDKYKNSLFTFLTRDGVPWHNNNAEHAIHSFARIRRHTDGTFTRRSVSEILTLLSVAQTCEYNGVSPLKFLLSGDTRISALLGTKLN